MYIPKELSDADLLRTYLDMSRSYANTLPHIESTPQACVLYKSPNWELYSKPTFRIQRIIGLRPVCSACGKEREFQEDYTPGPRFFIQEDPPLFSSSTSWAVLEEEKVLLEEEEGDYNVTVDDLFREVTEMPGVCHPCYVEQVRRDIETAIQLTQYARSFGRVGAIDIEDDEGLTLPARTFVSVRVETLFAMLADLRLKG